MDGNYNLWTDSVFMPRARAMAQPDCMAFARQVTQWTGRSEEGRIARPVLVLSNGHAWVDIRHNLPGSPGFIDTWHKRFAAERVAGLNSCHRGHTASVLERRPATHILDSTLTRKPTDSATCWTTRTLGQALPLVHDGVADLGQASIAAAQTRVLFGFERSRAISQAVDVIGPYSHPKAHGAALCVSEEEAIQALDRLESAMRLTPGVRTDVASRSNAAAHRPYALPSIARPLRCPVRPPRARRRPSLSRY